MLDLSSIQAGAGNGCYHLIGSSRQIHIQTVDLVVGFKF
ncbi:hypothetical protein Pan153_17670 [Gimesia panareensis]|uniref:Uncharacterized protein n=1 Tax=Gimesia panareensis TaxID=2527978 RepID=A0A518FL96_9PLAN|nr:hypothetical protein Pan153_17670 [Gimesia panareensis]